MQNYVNIANFGSSNMNNNQTSDPLTYCLGGPLDNRFLHGGHADILGNDSRQCQLYMSEYCANKWDSFCELASHNKTISYPASPYTGGNMHDTGVHCAGLNAGEMMIRNTAMRKYLDQLVNAHMEYEPFDPTVPNSPLISYWTGNTPYTKGVPLFSVDPKTIDTDPVMNKILMKPSIAPDVLLNIYNNMKRHGTLRNLKGTKLGNFYDNVTFFKNLGGTR